MTHVKCGKESNAMEEMPKYSSTIFSRDPFALSRKELQATLKEWKLPALGSTDILRQRYMSFREGKCLESQNYAKRTPDQNTSGKPEKRLKRFRTSPPQGVQQRIGRALSQSLYLVTKSDVDTNDLSCTFVVLGSTGNVYDVRIGRTPNCSCPDHAKGNLCKHILFVLLKVMAIPPVSSLVYQQAWIRSELEEMYSFMAHRFHHVSGSIMANAAVRNEYAKLQGRQSVVPTVVCRQDLEDCPICFEALEEASESTYCRSRCGARFHARCIDHWLGQQRSNPTCPMCREPWDSIATRKKRSSDEVFENLGRLQGQSPHRDTSSYSSWYRRYHGP